MTTRHASASAATRLSLLTITFCVFLGTAVSGADPGSVEFFENRIRPVLVQKCYRCHSADADEIGGSLLLDSSDAMMVGGDSGPAIHRGDADASVLISAIKYESSEMPPDEPLPSSVVDDFVLWINAGAMDPRQSHGATIPVRDRIDLDVGRPFWAFRPIGSLKSPFGQSMTEATADGHAAAKIDAYLSRAHQATSLVPVGVADPETRLRRLAFDLTGLPPSDDLMRRWLADPSPIQWTRLVDELLTSPQYAEHWARHWMDVARYADSNGSDFNATHHEAWRYRDYLIRCMAADVPFDQMIHQQIAGDLLPADNDDQRRDNVVASTFLMLGTKMLSERDKAKLQLDVVDEQIDTIGRAFLGMTLGCARCHDHKFDPVPTEDYYALAGIFKNTVTLKGESQQYVSTWNRVKLPTSSEHVAAVEKFNQQEAELQARIKEATKSVERAKSKSSAPLAGIVVDDADAKKVGAWTDSTYSKDFIGKGYVHDDNADKGKLSISFTTRVPESGIYELRLASFPNSNRAAKVPVTVLTADGEKKLTVDERKADIAPFWITLGKFRFENDADAVVTISNEGTSGYVLADAVQWLSESDLKPAETKSADAGNDNAAEAAAKQTLAALQEDLRKLRAGKPQPLPEAMAPSDLPAESIKDGFVHIRGEVNNVGAEVPRGFLRVCGSDDASIINPQGSGRLELASWLTNPDNPLVARVFVNRVWMHLMGEGLVRTVDNFGERGERPSHPQLLDALATDFVTDGWHLKPLIRAIVVTDAYQRSSEFDSRSYAIDPENRLLWRAHRRRLTAESIRDTMISIAGQLDLRGRVDPMQGRGVLVSSNDANSKASFSDVSEPCRSIYVPVVRSYVAPLLASLDGADPDLLVGRRPTTNVPSQALVLINSPDVNRWAEAAAQRLLAEHDVFDERLEATYRRCLGRMPSNDDRQMAADFFDGQLDSAERWHEYVAAIFASTEFRLLD
ncbi:DUF1553 domain-containing protein [Stieleria varia]|uniref:Xanthan lyase n=1 Tax=Stieleria varia TaxID=2528005 RepID=A0A5C6B0B5_9BACT|nr:DUF1553 domain-containing protein [Stieleria varia]TWU04726.1 Xanthan lyase precursor [Stieleria varia]